MDEDRSRKSARTAAAEAERRGRRLVGTIQATAAMARDLGRKAGEAGRGLAGTVSEQAAAGTAAALQPVRDIGRSVEGRRIAFRDAAVGGAVSSVTAGARRTAWGVTLHGANLAGAAGTAAWTMLWNPLDIVGVGEKFLDVRREVAEALAKHDALLAAAAEAERERLAVEAVARLKRWDHPRTRHLASAFVHVSVGPGRTEAWGMVLRGPHAGRSLAAIDRAVLADLIGDLPDEATAQALEAWCHALARTARQA
jgi:hypothetical protein